MNCDLLLNCSEPKSYSWVHFPFAEHWVHLPLAEHCEWWCSTVDLFRSWIVFLVSFPVCCRSWSSLFAVNHYFCLRWLSTNLGCWSVAPWMVLFCCWIVQKLNRIHGFISCLMSFVVFLVRCHSLHLPQLNLLTNLGCWLITPWMGMFHCWIVQKLNHFHGFISRSLSFLEFLVCLHDKVNFTAVFTLFGRWEV